MTQPSVLQPLARVLVVVTVAAAASLSRGAPGQDPSLSRGAPSPHLIRRSLVLAEVQAWKDAGYQDFIQFPDDKDQPAWAAVVGTQPVQDTDYVAEVKFHVFTQDNATDYLGTQVQLDVGNFTEAGWDASLPTKIIIHGFTNTITSNVIQFIKNAYLNQTNEGPVNVIGVDWGALCPAPLYVTSRLHVYGTGERVGQLLSFLVANNLTTPDKVHLIGHSLGAHVAGIAAKTADMPDKPSRVTGLDPAMPLFLLTPESDRLNATDGKIVDVIHTCAGRLGFFTTLGTYDFYPNGGEFQPGCGLDPFGICAHSMSYKLFAASIADSSFLAIICEDNADFQGGKCDDNPKGLMGEKTQGELGLYYLETSDDYPYQIANASYAIS